MKKLALAIIGLAVTLGLSYVGWLALVLLWSSLSELDKGIFAALITGTLVASGAIWVKHFGAPTLCRSRLQGQEGRTLR